MSVSIFRRNVHSGERKPEKFPILKEIVVVVVVVPLTKGDFHQSQVEGRKGWLYNIDSSWSTGSSS